MSGIGPKRRLHYTLDPSVECWRRRRATGDMIIVRHADDIIVGFQHEADARRFPDAMRDRFQEFALSLREDSNYGYALHITRLRQPAVHSGEKIA